MSNCVSNYSPKYTPKMSSWILSRMTIGWSKFTDVLSKCTQSLSNIYLWNNLPKWRIPSFGNPTSISQLPIDFKKLSSIFSQYWTLWNVNSEFLPKEWWTVDLSSHHKSLTGNVTLDQQTSSERSETIKVSTEHESLSKKLRLRSPQEICEIWAALIFENSHCSLGSLYVTLPTLHT